MSFLFLPFIAQGIVMGADEYLHHKRGLGRWEKIGHPLDTVTTLIPLLIVAYSDYSEKALVAFICMSVFSCLFITKDEFIHAEVCTKVEHWLHSLLFVLHPMVFFCAAYLWKYHPSNIFIVYQALLVALFLFYQILRWSILWRLMIK